MKYLSVSPEMNRKLFFAACTVQSFETVLKHSASIDTSR